MQYKYNNLKNFYKNKNILVTGHTGFKGSWLTSFLKYLNANILGISIDKIKQNDKSGFNRDLIDLEVISDINDLKNYSEQIKKFNPEIIFYLAAQPLVREAYINPLHTFKSNVMGLIEFLNFIKSYDHNIKTIIIITSDKVYEKNETKNNFTENDKLGGFEPYSASKSMQEIVSQCFFESYLKEKTNIVTVRAGNVLGGGDWGQDRLIVDIVKSVKFNHIMEVRYPNNTRPWQYILDLIFGYATLGAKVTIEEKSFFNSYNFAPKVSFPAIDIINFAKNYWGDRFNYKLSNSVGLIYEEAKLSIDSNKIYKYLGWETDNNLTNILEKTFSWYHSYLEKKNMSNYNKIMIEEFFKNK